MIHRNADPNDYHFGKYNGLGGKLDALESPLQAAVREVYEESGLSVRPEDLKPCGYVHFPNFKPAKAQDWTVFIFTGQYAGSEPPKQKCREGTLQWVPVSSVLELNLWPGDAHFLPAVLGQQTVSGAIWYDADGNVTKVEMREEQK